MSVRIVAVVVLGLLVASMLYVNTHSVKRTPELYERRQFLYVCTAVCIIAELLAIAALIASAV